MVHEASQSELTIDFNEIRTGQWAGVILAVGGGDDDSSLLKLFNGNKTVL
jgi:hypothetical protein